VLFVETALDRLRGFKGFERSDKVLGAMPRSDSINSW
jgi:hypothetical protein